MPSRVVGLPRAQAIRLAKYERDSLRLRARSSSKCPRLWKRAARQADLVLHHLYAGNDRAAGSAALRVAPAWKRAADCEGWASPSLGGPRTAAPGETNYPVVDDFTFVHFGVGALMSILGASQKQALAVAIGWELLERPMKRIMPGIFPKSTQDTVPNMIGDFVANLLGYQAMEKLR